MNPRAKELLKYEEVLLTNNIKDIFPSIKKNLSSFSKNNYILEDNVIISKNKIKFNCDISQLKEGDRVNGFIILLKDLTHILTTVDKYSKSTALYTFDDIIGESKEIKEVIAQCKIIANSPSTILITGESGCGKELLAQSIHNYSDLKFGPFIALNCGAIPKNLIESELFGYEEGTFTGATKGGRAGKFELADGGTIFLDEIGEMPIEMQVTLLRVIQEGVVTRIGGKTPIPVNVRIITATNKDLKEEVKKGNFRNDLFYRLNVIPIKLPPLRDRIGDVPVLINYFLKVKSQKLNKPIPTISQSLYKKMISYCWPGNIRELENCIENIVNLNGITTYELNLEECHCLTRDNLGNIIEHDEVWHGEKNVCLTCNDSVRPLLVVEQEEIKKALKFYNGNMSKVATVLGISRNALYNKIKRYNITAK
ncbi:AAA family ATPase [Clostridium tarantellae]|uniref:AAA family ATPase n=2 Tax=Clostridium tarantellae TaxID=39493 RepID=A0A6I1MNW4_9CLOT|nr:AAA family ATPase [Clostridium tarantellae]